MTHLSHSSDPSDLANFDFVVHCRAFPKLAWRVFHFISTWDCIPFTIMLDYVAAIGRHTNLQKQFTFSLNDSEHTFLSELGLEADQNHGPSDTAAADYKYHLTDYNLSVWLTVVRDIIAYLMEHVLECEGLDVLSQKLPYRDYVIKSTPPGQEEMKEILFYIGLLHKLRPFLKYILNTRQPELEQHLTGVVSIFFVPLYINLSHHLDSRNKKPGKHTE